MNPADIQRQLAEAYRVLASGDVQNAARLLQEALRAAPDNLGALNLLAGVKREQGDLIGALAALDRAVVLAPQAAPMLVNRANLLLELGRAGEAVRAYDAALAARPAHGVTFLNRARALAATGEHEAALADFEHAARLGVNDTALHQGRGLALAALQREAEALAAFDAAVASAPDDAGAHFNRARCLQALDQLEEALVAYDRAVNLEPSSASFWDNRGVALHDLDRLGEALASFDHALALDPDRAETRTNRGLTLFALMRADEAIAEFDRALALSPSPDPTLRYNRAMASLATHDLATGFPGFSARWEAGLVSSPRHDRGEPGWRGEALDGALRIWPEQGIGDEVLFARFAPLAAQRTPGVVLECAPRLAALFERSFETIEVRALNAEHVAAGAAQIALGDAPAALGVTRLDGKPYLRANSALRSELRGRYEEIARGRPIIGIAWTSKSPRRGPWKSAALTQWGALLRRKALFVNLQYGDTGADVAAALGVIDCTIHTDARVDQAADLDMFAAQIAAMDHVVSVSNTTVHLAGALGVPCLVMVPPARGRLWYWGLEGARTPWYDSVRIVRRALDEPWSKQVAAAAELLA